MVVIKLIKFAAPVKCQHCEYTFNNNRALDEHMENEHESQSEEKAKNEASPEEEIQVKYELDSVQNLKKAKSNLKRSTDLKRVPIDDENIKFEVHPCIYLELKEKAKEIKQGMEFEDSELGIKVKVTRTRRSVTKKKQFLKTPYGMKLQIQGLIKLPSVFKNSTIQHKQSIYKEGKDLERPQQPQFCRLS